ncbi:MAG: pyridoxamine 5'-phosphate oxidase family protein [Bdellovibrionales bacterium]|nr:pyridoxamine 5'-phosphate oxidase family protein [Massilia sp.]
MDSINQNQPEDNHENLAGEKAIKKMAELIKEAQTCFFCTSLKSGDVDARPMNVLEVDEQGNLWFMSASDSHKNQELQTDSSVRLFFQGSPHSKFLHLEGTATVSKDKARIKELWKFILKTWFTEGQHDPRITVIKVTPTHGYYWDNKHGNAIAGVKMMLGAAIGVTLDDSIEGDIAP